MSGIKHYNISQVLKYDTKKSFKKKLFKILTREHYKFNTIEQNVEELISKQKGDQQQYDSIFQEIIENIQLYLTRRKIFFSIKNVKDDDSK